MSFLHRMITEVDRCMKERGMPVCVQINPITKAGLESEMRLRPSFNNANAQRNARQMVINRLYEVDGKGKRVPNGWEIAVESNDKVPMNQFWVGVDGYEISRTELGRKIPHSFLRFPGRD